jgi:hypothetical protein
VKSKGGSTLSSWCVNQCLTSRVQERTQSRNLREILSLACRGNHSFWILFYATVARCTVSQESDEDFIIICEKKHISENPQRSVRCQSVLPVTTKYTPVSEEL